MLTVAGSDSSGGAGIQADIKTATLCGVYAMSAVTAVTAQNSLGVSMVSPVGKDALRAQLEAVLADGVPDAVKIGMIPDADSVRVIADCLGKSGCRNIVIDPVMVSTSGHGLSSGADEMLDALKEKLYPMASLLTPNLDEAKVLARYACDRMELDYDEFAGRGQFLQSVIYYYFRCPSILLKGGHSDDDSRCLDVLSEYCDGTAMNLHYSYDDERLLTWNDHGTGCVLSSAIACGLAKGLEMTDAVKEAKIFIGEALRTGADYEFGQPGGHGPLYLIV